jgi:hypothetical protein
MGETGVWRVILKINHGFSDWTLDVVCFLEFYLIAFTVSTVSTINDTVIIPTCHHN